MQKARVMVRRDLKTDTWTEQHFGVVINSSDWGAQIYDNKSDWGDLSPQMWSFCEWFPWRSRCVKVELL